MAAEVEVLARCPETPEVRFPEIWLELELELEWRPLLRGLLGRVGGGLRLRAASSRRKVREVLGGIFGAGSF